MTRSESNSKRTNIKKSAISKKAIKQANNLLGQHGVRICKYTGELLELNSTNFHKLSSDKYGFQGISKLGHKLYRDGQLEVKQSDRDYIQHDEKIVTTA